MNELDVEPRDRLTEIFEMQLDLQRRYHTDWDEMTVIEQIEYLKYNVIGLSSEVAEAMQEVGWKPWATAHYIDRDPFVGELVDVTKFLLNLMLRVGVTPTELSQRFRGKTAVNHARHDTCYDGVSGKCVTCKRALDEPHVA